MGRMTHLFIFSLRDEWREPTAELADNEIKHACTKPWEPQRRAGGPSAIIAI